MQVLAKVDAETFICQVKQDELEKFYNLYYGRMATLGVGQIIDLGKGYDYSAQIGQACRKMTDAMEAFSNAQKTLTAFAQMVANYEHPQSTTP